MSFRSSSRAYPLCLLRCDRPTGFGRLRACKFPFLFSVRFLNSLATCSGRASLDRNVYRPRSVRVAHHNVVSALFAAQDISASCAGYYFPTFVNGSRFWLAGFILSSAAASAFALRTRVAAAISFSVVVSPGPKLFCILDYFCVDSYAHLFVLRFVCCRFRHPKNTTSYSGCQL